MNAARQLHDLGQSLWLDNITRALLDSGTLGRYIGEFAVTGLTSNPTIFDKAIRSAGDYDEAIRTKATEGRSGEGVSDAALADDLRRQGTEAFAASWRDLMQRIASKIEEPAKAGRA